MELKIEETSSRDELLRRYPEVAKLEESFLQTGEEQRITVTDACSDGMWEPKDFFEIACTLAVREEAGVGVWRGKRKQIL